MSHLRALHLGIDKTILTLRQIEAFKAVMEVGTVLGAAEAMHVSQSAVSHLLSDLETGLGYRLFERRKGKLSPRREAQQLYTEVERSFSGLDRIQAAARRIGRKEGGRLRVATLPAGCQSVLPRAATRLLANHPRIWLSVQTRPPLQLIEEVASQQFDLGLTTLPANHPEVEIALVHPTPFHCIVHLGHPLADREAVTLEDVRDVGFIAPHGEGTTQQCREMEVMFRRANAEFRVALECSTMGFACQMAAAGVGVLLAPPMHIPDFLRPQLRVVPFTPAITVDVAVLYPKRRPPGTLARRFIETLGQVLQAGAG